MNTEAPQFLHIASDDLRAQAIFLAQVQHGLRTPITTVIGYCKELLTKETDNDNTNALEQMLLAGQKMLTTVDTFISEQTLSRRRASHSPVMSSLSHDLRNSVHIVQMYADILLDELRDKGGRDYLRDLSRIRHAGEEVLLVVEDLRGKTESGEAPMAKEAVSSLSALEPRATDRASAGTVMVVEDHDDIRELVQRQIERYGYEVLSAANGRQALQVLQFNRVDIILLDLLMPEMNGYEMLAALRADENFSQIPVIVISAFNDLDSIERCIELGADEYLPKTYNPALLKARLAACLEKKRFRDRERKYLKEIEEEKRKSDRLLQSILPLSVAERLKRGEKTIADFFPQVSVLFADLVDFTEFAAATPAGELVASLNQIFTGFDELVDAEGLEKIKTIGDAYMVAGGLPDPRPDHAEAVVRLGIAMLKMIGRMNRGREHRFQLRIGIHSGPVVAGVIGRSKFSYDLWGDTVNVASRMETDGVPGWIQISKATHDLVGDCFSFEERGTVPVHGKGTMTTYLLNDE